MSFGRAVGEMRECQPDLTTVEESTRVRVARLLGPVPTFVYGYCLTMDWVAIGFL